MLTRDQNIELNNFLNRLQGKVVRVELSSRLNIGFRLSFAVKLEKQADNYIFTSKDGGVSIFINPNEAEGFSSDSSSISLLYGDNLISVRFARTR
jgi:hypothetical protein